MPTIEETVQAGIDWLDEEGPPDWRDRIDLTRLNNMETLRDCPLGQTGTKSPLIASEAINAFYAWGPYDYSQLQAEWTRRLHTGDPTHD